MASWLKIQRTIEHFEAVKNTIAQDVASYGNRFTIKADGKETFDLLEPSPLISLEIGELLYQLRSTLDHLAFDLVKMNRSGIILPSDWEEHCAFPIWVDPLKPGKTPPLPLCAFKNLPGIPIEAHTIIESAQPYYPQGSINNYLRFFAKLSNIDKHRRFALMRARAKVRRNYIYQSGSTGASLETFDHGAEFPIPYAGEDDPIVNVETSTSLTIAFDEREVLGDATTVPIDDFLGGMLNDVFGKIIFPLNQMLS